MLGKKCLMPAIAVLALIIFDGTVRSQIKEKEATKPNGKKITLAMLRNLLGKTQDSEPYRDIQKILKDAPTIENVASNFYHCWFEQGLQVRFNQDGKAVRVLLVDGKAADLEYKRYQNDLPGGMTFEDTKQVVKRKLGPPDLVIKDGEIKGRERYCYDNGLELDFSLRTGTLEVVTLWLPFKAEFSAATLRELIGKDHRSKELRVLQENLIERPTAWYPRGVEGFFHQWHSKGINISFGEKNEVETISLFAGATKDPKTKYPFELPEKLSFKDSLDDVKRTLGMPEETVGGLDDLPMWINYESKGLSVEFNTRGKMIGIEQIRLYTPSKRKNKGEKQRCQDRMALFSVS